MIDAKSALGKLDKIDGELLKLLIERFEVSRDPVIAMGSEGAALEPARERAIMSRASSEAAPEDGNAIRLMFSTLFGLSKAGRRRASRGESPLVAEISRAVEACSRPFPTQAFVACCGTEGSYAQQAVSRLVKAPTIVYFSDFENVFVAVEKGLCPYGVLPVENSAVGSVAAVYDLMQRHSFHIARALRLKVDHVLLALPGVKLGDVREISSHPHALTQCAAFLKSLADVKALPAVNTAVAARELAASGRRDAAVIASRACAELYGLDVIADRVQDAVYNYTRFICISKDLEIYPDANRISIMLSLPHRPGALAAIISRFAAVDVNLTKLESRPIPGMDFEFSFIFDFEASPSDPAVLSLLSELSQDPEIERFEFLGAYQEK